MHIVDVTPLIYDDKGDWRTDAYVDDMVHHTEQGYEELAALVRPMLEELYPDDNA